MYSAAARLPKLPYAHPWEAPGWDAEGRLARLSGPGPGIVWLYGKPDDSTFRYRVWNMLQALEAAPRPVRAAWLDCSELALAERFLRRADALVLCRVRHSAPVAALVARARALGVRVLFDVDDLVFEPRAVPLLMDTLGADAASDVELDYWWAYCSRLGATLALCDAAVATNEALAARLRESAGLPVRLVPNVLNREQCAASERVLAAKRGSGWLRDGRLHMGYFSGSPSHNRDFALLAPVLARLMDARPELHLRLAGFLDPGTVLSRHAGRVERLPFTDWVDLQRLVGQTELNLVPLQDNGFTNCKSELKYFEAAAVGTATVATPTHAFRAAIRHGETGWLARAQDWEAVLSEVLAEPDALPAVAERACADAAARFRWDGQAGAILEAVLG